MSENRVYLILGVVIIRIPLFRVLYGGPLILGNSHMLNHFPSAPIKAKSATIPSLDTDSST